MAALDFSLFRTPIELTNKVVRARHRVLDKEVQSILAQIDALAKQAAEQSEAAVPSEGDDVQMKDTVDSHFEQHIQPSLQTLVGRIKGLKRKMQQSWSEDQRCLEKCRLRITQQEEFEADVKKGDKEKIAKWNQLRLNRYLADYLFRTGCSETAHALVQQQGLEPLVDIEIFESSRVVIAALKRHDCSEALKWCNENRLRLKKLECSLEFQLHLQEYIELVRKHDFKGAIAYARKHLGSAASQHQQEAARAMSLLCFIKHESCHSYDDLLDSSRWDNLISSFKHANYELHYLPRRPMLEVALEAGMCSLKTPHCAYSDSKNVNCPMCNPAAAKLAANVPLARRSQSSLVCRLSGAIMNEDNPPMVFPNGTVYSQNALVEMAKVSNGFVSCPRTGERCRLTDLRKAFIS